MRYASEILFVFGTSDLYCCVCPMLRLRKRSYLVDLRSKGRNVELLHPQCVQLSAVLPILFCLSGFKAILSICSFFMLADCLIGWQQFLAKKGHHRRKIARTADNCLLTQSAF